MPRLRIPVTDLCEAPPAKGGSESRGVLQRWVLPLTLTLAGDGTSVPKAGRADFATGGFGCAHFRIDPSYLPELRAYLTKLLATRERLAAAVPALAEWARHEAVPSDDEIETVRRLISACEDTLGGLEPDDRGTIEEAIRVLRQGRATLDIAVPVQFRGLVTQPSPTLFPIETEAARAR